MPFDYPEPDESSPYPHTALKPNFNIILASKLNFPKQSHAPSTNHVRGNKSTPAYSVLTSQNILTICLSIVKGILKRVKIKRCAFTLIICK